MIQRIPGEVKSKSYILFHSHQLTNSQELIWKLLWEALHLNQLLVGLEMETLRKPSHAPETLSKPLKDCKESEGESNFQFFHDGDRCHIEISPLICRANK